MTNTPIHVHFTYHHDTPYAAYGLEPPEHMTPFEMSARLTFRNARRIATQLANSTSRFERELADAVAKAIDTYTASIETDPDRIAVTVWREGTPDEGLEAKPSTSPDPRFTTTLSFEISDAELELRRLKQLDTRYAERLADLLERRLRHRAECIAHDSL